MDLATLIGILGAFGIIIASIVFGGDASPLIFLNVPSLLIVIIGSFLVVMMKFSIAQFLGALKVATRAFINKNESPESMIEQIIEISTVARKQGLLALEEIKPANTFLAQGIQMLADGQDGTVIKEVLKKDIYQTIDRHKWGAKVFSAMGDVAPAMGMIGTLIGLVQMLSNMEDPKSIGPAMAVALLTTLYGAMLANMVALPIADKLTLRKSEESNLKQLCLDGILGIQEGHNSRVLEGLLKVYLNPKQRDGKKDKKGGKGDAAAAAPEAKAA